MKVIDKKEEFIEYSKNHSLEETAEHFNIVKPYAQRLRREWCGITVPRYRVTVNIKKSDFVKYKKNHTLDDCTKHFNISRATAFNLCKKYKLVCYRNRTDPYIVKGHDILKEFPLYAKDHSQKECADYFQVSPGLVKWWEEKYNVQTKKRARTLKQVARMLYILDDGKKLYYFTNYDDIAQFTRLTRTRVSILISKEGQIHEYKVRKEKITSYRFQADKKRKNRHTELDL